MRHSSVVRPAPVRHGRLPVRRARGPLARLLASAVTVVLLATSGTTVGKRLFGLRVVRLDGSRASIPQVLLRTLLLCLIIPAAVWDRDTRGLHDKAVGTVEVRI